MRMGNLVAQQFEIQLARLYHGADGRCEQQHFIVERPRLGWRQVEKLRGVGSGYEDAIAVVELPRAEHGDGTGKLPDEFIVWQLRSLLDFQTQRASGIHASILEVATAAEIPATEIATAKIAATEISPAREVASSAKVSAACEGVAGWGGGRRAARGPAVSLLTAEKVVVSPHPAGRP